MLEKARAVSTVCSEQPWKRVPKKYAGHLLSELVFGLFAQEFEKCRGRVRESHPAPMRYPKRALVSQVLDRNRGETTTLQFFSDAHPRHEAQADFQLHEALDGFNRRQFKRDVERCVMLRESFDHSLPRARRDIMSQERFVTELGNCDRSALRQRMVGIHDEDQFIPEQRKRFEVAINRLEGQQGKVDVPVQHFAW